MVHSTRFGLFSASIVALALAAGCGDESGGGATGSGGAGEGGAGVTSTAGPGATSGNGPTTGSAGPTSGSGSASSGNGPTSGPSGPSTVTSSGAGGDGGGGGEPDPCAGIDPNSLYAQTAVDFSTLQTVNLCEFQGEVLLIANIAALCGYTYQMADLQYLDEHFGAEGFRVLGFISNDFGGQAGSQEELEACNEAHGITFQEYDRAPVLTDPQPVFAWLQAQANPGPEASLAPSWNFNKYIVSRSGQLVGKYSEHEAWGTDSAAPAFDASLAVQKIREQIALP
jgi:glutathione peroxidase